MINIFKYENKNKNSLNQKEVLRNREKYRKNIFDVLSNLSENYSSNFPFLLYYKKFREILKDVMKNHQYLRYYDVDILITIAEELESQIWLDDKYTNLNIDSNNNALINYCIKRIFGECVTAIRFENMIKEIMLKASLYNLFQSITIR